MVSFGFRPDDPLDRLLAAAKDTREQKAKARRVNDEIDQYLRNERLRQARIRAFQVKLLLLGQSESGKSTTLKQFALLHSVNCFSHERTSWRAIIYINLIASLRRILDCISEDDHAECFRNGVPESSRPGSSKSTVNSVTDNILPHIIQTRLQFAPLFSLEESLVQKLNSSDDITAPPNLIRREACVRSGAPWKKYFSKGKGPSLEGTNGYVEEETADEAAGTMHRFRDELFDLWNNAAIRKALRQRRVRIEDESGFFLGDIHRITNPSYLPTDDDILRARLKTLGVAEYSFIPESDTTGGERDTEWRIYDVGGARHQRYSWAPYFDDVDAVIFLAPLSVFDQQLAEDPTVNRLQDSMQLWADLCSNEVLASIPIVLFLNKCDLLKAKLEAGIQVKDYITSYKDRPNEYDAVCKYFRFKFRAVQKKHSAKKREIYIHFTSVTNTATISVLLASVKDTIYKSTYRFLYFGHATNRRFPSPFTVHLDAAVLL